ncbi:hypothetical protein ACFFRR_010748 [Megaselia abdita]
MLSNFIVTNQKLVVISDDSQNLPFERFFDRYVKMWLREQGKLDNLLDLCNIKALSIKDLSNTVETRKSPEPFTVILPSLTKLLQIDDPRNIIQFINSLKKSSSVRQVFLLSTTTLIPHELSFMPTFLEHMAQIVVSVTKDDLSILSRQSGGSVTRKSYTYKIDGKEMLVKQLKALVIKKEEEVKPVEHPFKIKLEEEEMLARNAVKLPYEKTSEADIIYTPDADDDFDEEDPDEDLYI